MAVNHDFQCGTCDRLFDAIFSVNTDHPVGPPCPTCGGATERVFLPHGYHGLPDAVVVYRAPDGSFRFPGETAGASTAKYDAMGYERIEARGWADVRLLESRLNGAELRRLSQLEERRCAAIEATEHERRSEITRCLDQGFPIPERRLNPRTGRVEPTGRTLTVHLSARGRDTLRAVMARNDAKGHRRVGEPGLHVDAYSNSRSNRDDSRRADGTRYRD